MDSILNSIKKLLGIDPTYTVYDTDIIIHINSVLNILTQLGVGPSSGFIIENANTTWSEFIGSFPDLELIRTFTYMKVKLIFDPPTSSAAVDSMNNILKELEWRIYITAERLNRSN